MKGYMDVIVFMDVIFEEVGFVLVMGVGFGVLENVCLSYVIDFEIFKEVVCRLYVFMGSNEIN